MQYIAKLAQDTFTDRLGEVEVFDNTIKHFHQEIKSLSPDVWNEKGDFVPRKNILTFYGIGGIGKSSLLKKLNSRVTDQKDEPTHWPSSKLNPIKTNGIYINLAEGSSLDIENILIKLRSLATEYTNKCRAFDLLFSAYWENNHPEISIDDYIKKNSGIYSVAKKSGFKSENFKIIKTLYEDILKILDMVIPFTQTGSNLLRKLHNKVFGGNIHNNYPLFSQLESHATKNKENLSFLANALAWDLYQAQKESNQLMIVFLDTFEELKKNAETELQKLIWCMPNILFVIAGRDRITWDTNNSHGLFKYGSENWVSLPSTNDQTYGQHLVGRLSKQDVDSFLKVRLSENQLTKSILDDIYFTTEGHPYHIDLICDKWQEQHFINSEINLSEIILPFSQLAQRFIQDLEKEERHSLRACCLFDCFDVELINKTSSLNNSGPVEKLLSRSIVRKDGIGIYKYYIHKSIRKVLIECKDNTTDSWSYLDWEKAAKRATEELIIRIDNSKNENEKLTLTLMLVSLCRTFKSDELPLVEILDHFLLSERWDINWKADSIEGFEPIESWISLYCQAAEIIFNRQNMDRKDTSAKLEAILCNTNQIELDLPKYFWAESLRDCGNTEKAAEILESLSGENKHVNLRAKALHGIAHILKRKSEFKKMNNLILTNSSILPAPNRLLGDLYWTQGEFKKSSIFYEKAIEDADSNKNERLNCIAQLLFVLSFYDKNKFKKTYDTYSDLILSSNQSFSSILIRIAEINFYTDIGSKDEFYLDVIKQAKSLNQLSLVAYASFCATINFASVGMTEKKEKFLNELKNSCKDKDFSYLLEIIYRCFNCEIGKTLTIDWHTSEAISLWKKVLINGKL